MSLKIRLLYLSLSICCIINAQPIITSFSPKTSSIGNYDTIIGSNFSSDISKNIVYFGPTKANVVYADSAKIVAQIPKGVIYDHISVEVEGLIAVSTDFFLIKSASGNDGLFPGTFDKAYFIQVEAYPGYSTMISAVKDVNGDGLPDIASIPANSDTLSILINNSSNGQIAFQSALKLPSLNNISSLAVGDLDGDGKQDIIASNKQSSLVTVIRDTLTNNTNFNVRNNFSSGSVPKSIVLVDLNNDGRLDIITINSGSSISILRNTSINKVLSFAFKQDISLSSIAVSLEVSDFDGDGKWDISIANGNGPGKLDIFRNTSSLTSITFAPKVEFAFNDYISDIGIADFDRDLKPDIIAAMHGDSNSIRVYRNTSINGIVKFDSIYGMLPYSAFYGNLAIADIDNDGNVDVFASDQSYANFALLRNITKNNKIDFIAKAKVSNVSLGNSTDLITSDFNGDGLADVLVNGINNGKIGIFKHTGIFMHEIDSIDPLSGPIGTQVNIYGKNFNVNADSNLVYFGTVKSKILSATADKIVTEVPYGSISKEITLTIRPYTVASAKPFNITIPCANTIDSNTYTDKRSFTTGNGSNNIAIGDLNLDGKPDIVVTNGTSNTISIFSDSSSANQINLSSNLTLQTLPQTATPNRIQVSDIDGDGKLDIIVSYSGSNYLSIFINKSIGNTFSFDNRYELGPNTEFTDFKIAEIDGDAKPDIIGVSSLSDYVLVIQNLSTPGNLSFKPQPSLYYTNVSDPIKIEILDLNNDLKNDLVVLYKTSPKISVFKNLSSINVFSFDTRLDIIAQSNPIDLKVADLDGDNKADFILGVNFQGIYLYRNIGTNGSISFSTPINSITGITPVALTANDYNGDGKPDLSYINTTTNKLNILKNSSSIGVFNWNNSVGYPISSNSVAHSTVDLNSDGKPEILVVNNNSVSTLMSNLSTLKPVSTIIYDSSQKLCLGFNLVLHANVGNQLKYQWYRNGISIPNSDSSVYSVTNNGIYKVLVSDSFHCQALSNEANVNFLPKPICGYSINKTNQCLSNNSFLFMDTTVFSYGVFTRIWNFGSGVTDTSSLANPQKSYQTKGVFKASLLVTGSNGCKDSLTKSLNVLSMPKANFNLNQSNACFRNNTFSLYDSSIADSGLYSRIWYLGNLTDTSSKSNIVKSFNSSGSFNIQLKIDAFGCKDSVSKQVEVYPSPISGFNVNNMNQCIGNNSFILNDTSIITNGSIQSIWDFGNNTNSQLKSPVVSYPTSGNYSIKLISVSNHFCKDSVIKNISVYPMPVSKMNINNVTQCLSGNKFYFYDSSTISSGNYNLTWKFGDGNSSSVHNTTNSYLSSGVYLVTLITISDHQCKDSINKQVIVFPQPIVGPISGSLNAKVNDTIHYIAQIKTGNNYFWSVFNGEIKSGQFTNDILVKWLTSPQGKLTLLLIDSNSCKDSSTIDITIGTNGMKTLTENSIQIYPNPFKDCLYLTNGDMKHSISNILITDLLGRVILQKSIDFDTHEYTLQLGDVPIGNYIIRLYNKDGESINKIISKR